MNPISQSQNQIFVWNLPRDTLRKDIGDYIEKVIGSPGSITSIRIPPNKQYAFITFKKKHFVEVAIKKCNKMIFKNSKIFVKHNVSKSQVVDTLEKKDWEKIKKWINDETISVSFTINSDLVSLLHYAVMEDNIEMIKFLLSKRMNKDINDKLKRTPLHYCCIYRKYQSLKLLLQKGCKINVFDAHGNTPLHCASQNGLTNFVNLIVRKSANLKINYPIKNNQGKTAKDLWNGKEDKTNLFSNYEKLFIGSKNHNIIKTEFVSSLPYCIKDGKIQFLMHKKIVVKEKNEVARKKIHVDGKDYIFFLLFYTKTSVYSLKVIDEENRTYYSKFINERIRKEIFNGNEEKKKPKETTKESNPWNLKKRVQETIIKPTTTNSSTNNSSTFSPFSSFPSFGNFDPFSYSGNSIDEINGIENHTGLIENKSKFTSLFSMSDSYNLKSEDSKTIKPEKKEIVEPVQEKKTKVVSYKMKLLGDNGNMKLIVRDNCDLCFYLSNLKISVPLSKEVYWQEINGWFDSDLDSNDIRKTISRVFSDQTFGMFSNHFPIRHHSASSTPSELVPQLSKVIEMEEKKVFNIIQYDENVVVKNIVVYNTVTNPFFLFPINYVDANILNYRLSQLQEMNRSSANFKRRFAGLKLNSKVEEILQYKWVSSEEILKLIKTNRTNLTLMDREYSQLILKLKKLEKNIMDLKNLNGLKRISFERTIVKFLDINTLLKLRFVCKAMNSIILNCPLKYCDDPDYIPINSKKDGFKAISTKRHIFKVFNQFKSIHLYNKESLSTFIKNIRSNESIEEVVINFPILLKPGLTSNDLPKSNSFINQLKLLAEKKFLEKVVFQDCSLLQDYSFFEHLLIQSDNLKHLELHECKEQDVSKLINGLKNRKRRKLQKLILSSVQFDANPQLLEEWLQCFRTVDVESIYLEGRYDPSVFEKIEEAINKNKKITQKRTHNIIVVDYNDVDPNEQIINTETQKRVINEENQEMNIEKEEIQKPQIKEEVEKEDDKDDKTKKLKPQKVVVVPFYCLLIIIILLSLLLLLLAANIFVKF